MRGGLRIAVALVVFAVMASAATAGAHSSRVWPSRSHERLTIFAETGCHDRIALRLHSSGQYHTLVARRRPTSTSFAGITVALSRARCRRGVEESFTHADFSTFVYPNATLSFMLSVKRHPVEGGVIVARAYGHAPERVRWGTDAYVNYCIDGLHEITSINGELGCYTASTLHDVLTVRWNHRHS